MDRLNIPNPIPPIYHLPPVRFYLLNTHDGYWQEMTLETTRRRLVSLGQNPIPNARGELSEVDSMLLRIQEENRVDTAISLGWEEPGVQLINGRKVLVENGCTKISPVKGEWRELQTYLQRLFGTEEQLQYYLAWQATGTRGFYFAETRRYGQCLILAGPTGAGKSFLQVRVITPALGGKLGKPYRWLTKRTDFNSDLFEAVSLVSSDDFYMSDRASRKEYGAMVKQITSDDYQEYNKKHGCKYTCKAYWRLSISLNGEAQYLATLPELDQSLLPKMIILECEPDAIHLPTRGPEGNVMEREVAKEMPAFLHYLLFEHQIPPEIADGRYGVKGFANKHVQEEIRASGDEYLLLECLREKYAGLNNMGKSTYQIIKDLDTVDTPKAVRKMLLTSASLQGVLEKLVQIEGGGVAKGTLFSGQKGWFLTFPKPE